MEKFLGNGLEGIVHKISDNVVRKKWKGIYGEYAINQDRFTRVKEILEKLPKKFKNKVKTPEFLGYTLPENESENYYTFHEFINGELLENCKDEIIHKWYDIVYETKIDNYLYDLHTENIIYYKRKYYIIDCMLA